MSSTTPPKKSNGIWMVYAVIAVLAIGALGYRNAHKKSDGASLIAQATPAPAPLTAQQKIPAKVFEAYNEHKYDKILSFYSSDICVRHQQTCTNGIDAIIGIIKRWSSAFKDLQFEPIKISQEGDIVTVHWLAHGIHVGQINDIPPSGKPVTIHGMTCFRMQNGKIIEQWNNIDYQNLQRKDNA